jgi:hypothetical protein
MHPKYKKQLILIILFGLFLRVLFTLFGAELYFGDSDFYYQEDTYSYTQAAKDIVNHGSYKTSLDAENYSTGRTPTYSIFIALVYLISGKNMDIAMQLIIWIQVLLDAVCILLLYSISHNIFKSQRLGLVAAGLYAIYPFIIFRTPIIASESLGIILLIASLYFFVKDKKHNYLISGILIGAAILCKIQIAAIIPFMFLYLIITKFQNLKKQWVYPVLFLIGFSIVYIPWPIRNYFTTGELILTLRLSGEYESIGSDVVAFKQYINTVQPGLEPQFTQLIEGKHVDWPKKCYLSYEDSVKLRQVEYLSQNCGSGFSKYINYWNKDNYRMPDSLSCNKEISDIFSELREKQISKYPIDYKLWVPLGNLKTALLKTSLHYSSNTLIRVIAVSLFVLRTVLLLLGLIGLFFMIRRRIFFWSVITGLFVLLYYYVCFVTRNIEMRYLLPADILMLIPAAFLITMLYKWYAIKQHKRNPENFRI